MVRWHGRGRLVSQQLPPGPHSPRGHRGLPISGSRKARSPTPLGRRAIPLLVTVSLYVAGFVPASVSVAAPGGLGERILFDGLVLLGVAGGLLAKYRGLNPCVWTPLTIAFNVIALAAMFAWGRRRARAQPIGP